MYTAEFQTLIDDLKDVGLDAKPLATGGGLYVAEIPIDSTARDTYRVCWISDEGADVNDLGGGTDNGFIIGFYDFLADECDEGVSFTFHPVRQLSPDTPRRTAQVAAATRGMLERVWATFGAD